MLYEAQGTAEYACCASHRVATCYHKPGKAREAFEWLNKSAAIKGK